MTYSRNTKEGLKNIQIKDRIKLTKKGKTFEGLLMPGDNNTIIIKLDNGYNIGIKYTKNVSIKKRKKQKKKTEKKTQQVKPNKDNPPVSMISVGGTISSKVDYETGAVKALMNPKEILENVPELNDIIYLKDVISPFTKMSEDMEPKDWQNLAKLCAKKLNSNVKGLIITHGTDTLHYTAAALSFMLKNPNKPVVLTGSQRSSDRGSSDAGMNLICSSHAAISDMAEVGICMHGTMSDDYCLFSRGTKVKKMHTSRRDAFRPINTLPLAKILPNCEIEKLIAYNKRNNKKVKADTVFEKVALVKVYPGSDPAVLDYYLSNNVKGFVIEATGLGHVPTKAKNTWIPAIKKLIKQGIPVCTAAQTMYGRLNPNVYTNLRILYKEAGAIPLEDMLPETAYVKLGWVLGHTNDLEKAKNMMLENMAGEISERTAPSEFLY